MRCSRAVSPPSCVPLQSVKLYTDLQRNWDAEVDHALTSTPPRAPSFRRAYLWTFRWEVFTVTALLLIKHSIQLLQTQFLAHLLTFYTTSTSSDLTDGYLYALGIVGSTSPGCLSVCCGLLSCSGDSAAVPSAERWYRIVVS